MGSEKKERGVNLYKLIVSVLLTIGAPLIGGAIGGELINYTYTQELVRPWFAPPEWLFGVVWPVLYILMAFALYRAWTRCDEESECRSVIILYCIQIILNASFMPIFFGLRLTFIGFVVCLLLTIVLVILIRKFFAIDKVAGYALVPYFLWMVFATVLSFSIWFLNA